MRKYLKLIPQNPLEKCLGHFEGKKGFCYIHTIIIVLLIDISLFDILHSGLGFHKSKLFQEIVNITGKRLLEPSTEFLQDRCMDSLKDKYTIVCMNIALLFLCANWMCWNCPTYILCLYIIIKFMSMYGQTDKALSKTNMLHQSYKDVYQIPGVCNLE